MCIGVEGPKGVFKNTRTRSSSWALEARNGNDSSETKTRKAKDTKQSSKPPSAGEAKTDDDESMKRSNASNQDLCHCKSFANSHFH